MSLQLTTNNLLLLLLDIPPQMFGQIFDQVFEQILAMLLTRLLEEGKIINTVCSTTRPEENTIESTNK